MLLDNFLPVYDVSDSVATVVNADVATTWDGLMQVDLIEVGRQRRAVGMLAALRALPEMVTDDAFVYWLDNPAGVVKRVAK